jgi:uncharacterized cupredoxin-like copper-binding protein
MNIISTLTLTLTLIAATASALTPGTAAAHGEAEHSRGAATLRPEQKPWGVAGNPKAVSRTIEVHMTDDMRFTPDRVEVRQGETIRFVLRNAGKVLHEFVLGTRVELDEHAALMVRFPNMEHDEPSIAHVRPARMGGIVWTFNRPGEFDFACLIAGHYQAGMVGKIAVTPAKRS